MRAPVRFSSVALAAVAVFAFTALYIADRELARSPALTLLRYGLWAVGVATLIALTLALVHERRLTRRVAERSGELERLSAVGRWLAGRQPPTPPSPLGFLSSSLGLPPTPRWLGRQVAWWGQPKAMHSFRAARWMC